MQTINMEMVGIAAQQRILVLRFIGVLFMRRRTASRYFWCWSIPSVMTVIRVDRFLFGLTDHIQHIETVIRETAQVLEGHGKPSPMTPPTWYACPWDANVVAIPWSALCTMSHPQSLG